ncbi:MAG: AMP-binding protein [Clostridia bacterium]|nr:AMP-binding protein [Clostridia bacterium]
MAKTPKYFPSLPIENMREGLRDSTRKYGDRPAFVQKINGEWTTLTYSAFLDRVEGFGTELYDRRLGGPFVMVIGEDCIAWGTAYLTVACGLGVVVPVDKEIPVEEFRSIAKSSGATAVIFSEKCRKKVDELDPSIVRISFDEIDAMTAAGHDKLRAGDTRYVNLPIDSNKMAVLLYTSGTTGIAKGVMLSHHNICHDITETGAMLWHSPEDIFLAVLPFHHAYPCTTSLLFPLFNGCCVAICQGLRYITRDLQEVKPTIICGVPMLVETLYRKIMMNIRRKGPKTEKMVKALIKLTGSNMFLKRRAFGQIHDSFGGRLRLIISGGAAVDPTVMQGLRDLGFYAVQGYGLTECAPLAAVNMDDLWNPGSAGLATPNGILDIYDMRSDGTGEIRFKGDNVMLGYYNDPENTEEVLKDGWFYTGDLGYIDENGFLFITGRKKNLIVTAGGKNVFPEELEGFLCRNPYVAEAVVVAYFNETRGDYDIVAVMFPDDESFTETYGKDYTRGQIEAEFTKAVDSVNASVQNYKHISYFVIRNEEFVKNTSKKIKRQGVAAEAQADYLRKLAEMKY